MFVSKLLENPYSEVQKKPLLTHKARATNTLSLKHNLIIRIKILVKPSQEPRVKMEVPGPGTNLR